MSENQANKQKTMVTEDARKQKDYSKDPAAKARKVLAKKLASQKMNQNFCANQGHAMALKNVLSQVEISNPLTDENFAIWSKQIMRSLKSLFLDQFMKTNPEQEEGETYFIDKRCIIEFIFSRMENTNSQRF